MSAGEHWYFLDGSRCFGVRTRDGRERSPTVRDAKRGVPGQVAPYGIVPSVTTILRALGKPPGLVNWLVRTTVECAATLPHVAGEDAETYAARLTADADRWRSGAAELGTRAHAAIAAQFATRLAVVPEDIRPVVTPAHEFLRDYLAPGRPRLVEHSFATPVYGGTCDLYARLADGRLAYIDLKTQGTTERLGHIPRAWDEWGEQLIAYADGIGRPFDVLVNVIVSTTKPGVVVAHEWTDAARLRDQWGCKLRYYQLTRDWWPERKRQPAQNTGR